MNRKLIVTLLKKDIQELDMITEGFMEMSEYPKAIINLAQRKVADIESYIQQLGDLKLDESSRPDEKIAEPVVLDIPKSEEKIVEVEEAPVEVPVVLESTEDIVETTNETTEVEIVEFLPVEEVKEEIQEKEEEIAVAENIEIKEVSEVITSTKIETKTTVEDTKRTILAEKISSHVTSRNDSLSKADNSLSSTLANKKIDDIKQAINIGDRFRFQRELFKGNGEDMNKTLNYINQLATLDEVQSFLSSKYGWEHGNDTVEDFYQIVKRRFI